ncbi:hypothetical protein GCM10009133_34990 [Cocleimonas flava]
MSVINTQQIYIPNTTEKKLSHAKMISAVTINSGTPKLKSNMRISTPIKLGAYVRLF